MQAEVFLVEASILRRPWTTAACLNWPSMLLAPSLCLGFRGLRFSGIGFRDFRFRVWGLGCVHEMCSLL